MDHILNRVGIVFATLLLASISVTAAVGPALSGPVSLA